MIGVYVNWGGKPIQEFQRAGMVGALGAGHRLPVHQQTFGNALLLGATKKLGWSPARTARGELVLFCGHIDNRADLRAKFGRQHIDDQELFAAAYERWGDDADLRVIGQFSAVILPPGGQSVRLTRSPLLAPPLHVWSDESRLIAASTARAIFSTGEITQEIDEQKLADSLVLNYCDEERGWFKGVRRVPVGSRALVSAGKISFTQYYDISGLPEVRLERDEDYVAVAESLFKEAVSAALDGYSRPAVSLSGGLDSQAVAAFAASIRPGKPLLGLTSVPERAWDQRIDKGRIGDESPYVNELASMYPELTVEKVDSRGLYIDHKQRSMFVLAGAPPVGPSNLHWIHEICARAKSRGCDVLLTGQMGNATLSFAGDGAIAGWLASGAWRSLFRELKSVRSWENLRRLMMLAIAPHLPAWLYRILRGFRHGLSSSSFESIFPINREYANEMRVGERARNFGHDVDFRPRRSTRDWRLSLWKNAPTELGDLWQGFELIHGISQRDPTAYRPLVEFCMGIPDDQYIRLGQTRWLARRLLKGKIPDSVLNETRKGLQSADWHLRMGRQVDALRSELDRLSNDPEMVRRFDLAVLQKALDNWPTETPIGDTLAYRLQFALTRGITAARFIRYVEGRNE